MQVFFTFTYAPLSEKSKSAYSSQNFLWVPTTDKDWVWIWRINRLYKISSFKFLNT